MLCLAHPVSTAILAWASFRIPMICSSLNRLFFIFDGFCSGINVTRRNRSDNGLLQPDSSDRDQIPRWAMQMTANLVGLTEWCAPSERGVQREDLSAQIVLETVGIFCRVPATCKPVGFVRFGQRHQQIAGEFSHRNVGSRREFHGFGFSEAMMRLSAAVVSSTSRRVNQVVILHPMAANGNFSQTGIGPCGGNSVIYCDKLSTRLDKSQGKRKLSACTRWRC